MDNSTKQLVKLTYEKINAAYGKLDLPEAKDYFLTLGNINEVYLMRKDAKKSTFIGRLFETPGADPKEEARKIWNGICSQFVNTTPQAPAKEESKPVAKTKKAKVTKPEQEANVEIDAKYSDDDNSDWVDNIQ